VKAYRVGGGVEGMLERDVMKQVYQEYDAYQLKEYVPSKNEPDDPRVFQVSRLVGNGKRVLDIGISRGDFAFALIKRGNEVIGLDISAKAIEICKSRGIKAYEVNIETDPLPDIGDFDAVLMLEILEHLIDPLTTLRKVRRVIRPSGLLLISTPNAAHVKWRLQLLRGCMPDFGENRRISVEPRPYNLLHKTPLAIPDLYKLLQMAGFKVVHLEPEDYGVSNAWDRPGLRMLRNWLRCSWPSMFAGAVVVKATPHKL
jgi:SAM-dependent methyltransferase